MTPQDRAVLEPNPLTMRLDGPVILVQSDEDPGDMGEPETLDVMEVWVNGVDIAAVLLERVAEQISDAVLNKIAAEYEAARDAA